MLYSLAMTGGATTAPSTILVLGGINLDLAGHTTGNASGRTSGNASGRTSTPGRVTFAAGGVGRNIAENLARLGCPVKLAGAVGDDLLSRWLLEHTAAAGVDVAAVQVIPGGMPGVYLSFLERGELDRAVADPGVMERMNGTMVEASLDRAYPATGPPPALLVLDTNPGEEALQAALDWAACRAVPVLVEPVSIEKSRRLRTLRGGVDYITPNTGEARDLLGARLPAGTGSPAGVPAPAVGGSLEIGTWIVTRGAAGAALFSLEREWGGETDVSHALGMRSRCGIPSGPARLFPAPAVDVVNVNGAGDAFVAALACGIVGGRSMEESVRMGLRAGAHTVASAETVSRNISLDLVLRDTASVTAELVVPWERSKE